MDPGSAFQYAHQVATNPYVQAAALAAGPSMVRYGGRGVRALGKGIGHIGRGIRGGVGKLIPTRRRQPGQGKTTGKTWSGWLRNVVSGPQNLGSLTERRVLRNAEKQRKMKEANEGFFKKHAAYILNPSKPWNDPEKTWDEQMRTLQRNKEWALILSGTSPSGITGANLSKVLINKYKPRAQAKNKNTEILDKRSRAEASALQQKKKELERKAALKRKQNNSNRAQKVEEEKAMVRAKRLKLLDVK